MRRGEASGGAGEAGRAPNGCDDGPALWRSGVAALTGVGSASGAKPSRVSRGDDGELEMAWLAALETRPQRTHPGCTAAGGSNGVGAELWREVEG
jgi:hypothetical protein